MFTLKGPCKAPAACHFLGNANACPNEAAWARHRCSNPLERCGDQSQGPPAYPSVPDYFVRKELVCAITLGSVPWDFLDLVLCLATSLDQGGWDVRILMVESLFRGSSST